MVLCFLRDFPRCSLSPSQLSRREAALLRGEASFYGLVHLRSWLDTVWWRWERQEGEGKQEEEEEDEEDDDFIGGMIARHDGATGEHDCEFRSSGFVRRYAVVLDTGGAGVSVGLAGEKDVIKLSCFGG